MPRLEDEYVLTISLLLTTCLMDGCTLLGLNEARQCLVVGSKDNDTQLPMKKTDESGFCIVKKSSDVKISNLLSTFEFYP